eukprot:TRINITY_DN15730_c0_g1_i1.p1 TRINITY_DN15730_c0_g1~~TRINITY_DN15730_c0_g1_i1.p1  ORF type:complete len:306 (+),score=37.07 TRINITY_DN15730_c0_g1_i1:58-975(+)
MWVRRDELTTIIVFFFLMIRRPPRSTQGVSSAASDVYKRQVSTQSTWEIFSVIMVIGAGYVRYLAESDKDIRAKIVKVNVICSGIIILGWSLQSSAGIFLMKFGLWLFSATGLVSLWIDNSQLKGSDYVNYIFCFGLSSLFLCLTQYFGDYNIKSDICSVISDWIVGAFGLTTYLNTKNSEIKRNLGYNFIISLCIALFGVFIQDSSLYFGKLLVMVGFCMINGFTTGSYLFDRNETIRKLVVFFILFSILIFLLSMLFFFFGYETFSMWLIYLVPWIIAPFGICLLYTSPSPRDLSTSRMPSSA